MGNGMNKVLPGLYLGNFRDGKDPEQLQNNQITHIISIHDTAKEVVEDKQYLCIRVPDSPDENLTKYFPRCNDFIHNARMGGGNVLVHCLAGVSRSATIATAYIMSATGLNCKDALKVIRGARNIANPNYGFHSQLKDFEFYSLNSERRRLKNRYSAFDNRKVDEEECTKMISVYNANIPSSSNSTPTHTYRQSSALLSKPLTSANSSPTHTYRKSSTLFNRPSPSASSTPTHTYRKCSTLFNRPSPSANSTPTHTYKKSSILFSRPSVSANSTPVSSPLHIFKKCRSATSSPKQ